MDDNENLFIHWRFSIGSNCQPISIKMSKKSEPFFKKLIKRVDRLQNNINYDYDYNNNIKLMNQQQQPQIIDYSQLYDERLFLQPQHNVSQFEQANEFMTTFRQQLQHIKDRQDQHNRQQPQKKVLQNSEKFSTKRTGKGALKEASAIEAKNGSVPNIVWILLLIICSVISVIGVSYYYYYYTGKKDGNSENDGNDDDNRGSGNSKKSNQKNNQNSLSSSSTLKSLVKENIKDFVPK